MRDSEGGTYLSEGADGCVFTAPDSWPCKTRLTGYDPNDPTLISKIVFKDDYEDDILRIVSILQKKYKLQNLPSYIGSCKPKIMFTRKRDKKVLGTHLQQLRHTTKACKEFRKSYKKGDFKMYVMKKYIGTLQDYTHALSEYDIACKHKLKIFEDLSYDFLQTLYIIAFEDVYNIIHYDMHSNNIVGYPLKGKFNMTNPNTFMIGPSDFGRAVWRKRGESYSKKVFRTWDLPFLEQFLIPDDSSDHTKTFSAFRQFSLEARLMNFIATCSAHKSDSKKLWIELWAKSPEVREDSKKGRDILYMVLPRLLKTVRHLRSYHVFERKLESLVRTLIGLSAEEQGKILQKSESMRKFLDALKSRSHLPTAYGVLVMNAMISCNYYIKKRQHYISDIQSAPEPLRNMLELYWTQLILPWKE